MEMILREYRESSETLASLCAGNLARLGRLYVREGRFNEAREVLALAARLGSMEAQVEMNNYSSREIFRNRYRLAG
jgi:Flp pilus assembly protein TadD